MWYLVNNGKGLRYVRTAVPDAKGNSTPVSVARLIAQAGPNSTIFFENGDRLDLRPENLFWHRKGVAKRCDAELARRGAEYRTTRSTGRRSTWLRTA